MNYQKTNRPTLLVADDDADDRMFLEQALRQTGYEHDILFVEDGEDLLDYLQHRGQYSPQNAPWPSLLLLDLNMPRVNGLQALAQIKQDPSLRRLPIVVMTTSNADEDVLKTYELGVNSFITKPFHFNRLVEMMDMIKTYWLDMVKLPQ